MRYTHLFLMIHYIFFFTFAFHEIKVVQTLGSNNLFLLDLVLLPLPFCCHCSGLMIFFWLVGVVGVVYSSPLH